MTRASSISSSGASSGLQDGETAPLDLASPPEGSEAPGDAEERAGPASAKLLFLPVNPVFLPTPSCPSGTLWVLPVGVYRGEADGLPGERMFLERRLPSGWAAASRRPTGFC